MSISNRYAIGAVYGVSIICWIVLFLAISRGISYVTKTNNDRAITILTWVDTIDEEIIKAFEQETGITVTVTHFESNEELFVKLYLGKGAGYDLVMPSDYVMPIMIKHDLLKPIDKSQLTFIDRIPARLMNHYFDTGNRFSVPYCWTIYGLGINTDMVALDRNPSWGLLFDRQKVAQARVGMAAVAREAVAITSLYLFGSTNALAPHQLQQIQKKLMEQKKYVAAYVDADFRANQLLFSQEAGIAVVTSANIARYVRDYPRLQFFVPQEGGFLLIDSVAIPRHSSKDALVYQFLNYLYQASVAHHHFKTFPLIPAVVEIENSMREQGFNHSIIDAHFGGHHQLHFFKNTVNDHALYDLWLSVKAA